MAAKGSISRNVAFSALRQRDAAASAERNPFHVKALTKSGAMSRFPVHALDMHATHEAASARAAEKGRLNPGTKYVVHDTRSPVQHHVQLGNPEHLAAAHAQARIGGSPITKEHVLSAMQPERMHTAHGIVESLGHPATRENVHAVRGHLAALGKEGKVGSQSWTGSSHGGIGTHSDVVYHLQTGVRGGQFYVGKGGKKVYAKK